MRNQTKHLFVFIIITVAATAAIGQSNPPVIENCYGNSFRQIDYSQSVNITYEAADPDPGDIPVWDVAADPEPSGAYYINSISGEFVYIPDSLDAFYYDFQFYIIAEDKDALRDTCILIVTVTEASPFSFKFSSPKDSVAYHGQAPPGHVYFNVYLDYVFGVEEWYDLNFLIGYDTSLLAISDVLEGGIYMQYIDWEYLAYENVDSCFGLCPGGLVRVTGIGDIENGDIHPDPRTDICIGQSLFTLDFEIVGDTSAVEYIPMAFYWMNCDDNTLHALDFNNDSAVTYSSDKTFNCNTSIIPDTLEITDNTFGLPGYFGMPDYCFDDYPLDDEYIRFIDFYSVLEDWWYAWPYPYASIIPWEATSGEEITFTGGGHSWEYGPEGLVDWEWNSSIDGFLSGDSSFKSTSLSEGDHTIYYRTKDTNGYWSVYYTILLNVGPGFCDDFSGLFCDDFSSGASPDWRETEGGCTWNVADGKYRAAMTGQQLSCVRSVGDNTWRNYVIDVKVKGVAGVDKIIRFRETENSWYFVNLRSSWDGEGHGAILGKQVDTVETILQTHSFMVYNDKWYWLRIICLDEHISVYLNYGPEFYYDDPILSYDDYESRIYSGGIGLACYTGDYGECDISFDHISVTNPFPIVTIDNPGVDFNVGDNISFTGTVSYYDGSPYKSGRSTIAILDPVSKQSVPVTTDDYGNFSYTSPMPTVEPGMWMHLIEANTYAGIMRSAYNIPVTRPNAGPRPELLRSERIIPVKSGQVIRNFDPATDVFSTRKKTNPVWDAVQSNVNKAAGAVWGAAKSLFAPSWKRTTTSGTSRLLYQKAETYAERCNPLNPLDGDCSNMTIMYAGLFGIAIDDFVWSSFHGATDVVLDEGDYDCFRSKIHAALDAGELISTVVSLQGSETIDILGGLSEGMTLDLVQSLEISLDECINKNTIDDTLYPYISAIFDLDTVGPVLFGLIPKFDKVITVNGYSPIDIAVENQYGYFLNKDTTNIPGALYSVFDSDLDGDMEQLLIVPVDSLGGWDISITPAAGAKAEDTFSVIANYTYYQEPLVIADNITIAEIPPDPIVIETFENQSPGAFTLTTPDDTLFPGFPCLLTWYEAVDPNPGHVVSYDIVIASLADLSDSLVAVTVTDTTFIFDGYPNREGRSSIDSVEYFWQITAHDDWGAGVISEIRSFMVEFSCGDVNADGIINILDITYLIAYLYLAGGEPVPPGSGYVNGDSAANILDITYIINFLYKGGPAPICSQI